MNSKKQEMLSTLRSLGACDDAVEWCSENASTLAEAWRTCPRGDWMLWLYKKAPGRNQDVAVRIACDLAERAARFASADTQLATLWALDATRRFLSEDADREELLAAKSAAYAAAYAARAMERAVQADIIRRHVKFSDLKLGAKR